MEIILKLKIFNGILPTLPPLSHYSVGYNPGELQDKISQIQNDELPLWTDSYNEGQLMNRLIQTARIAAEIGNEDKKYYSWNHSRTLGKLVNGK